MGWPRAMLSSAPERCSRLHCYDAPVCTATMLPLAPERCSPLHQGDALSCTKSNRAYRLILEEVFPRLEGRPSRKAKGDLHPTATRLFY